VSRLTEQMRYAKSRPYRMRRRAEQVDETRLRITEAAMRLHTTIGPARTSIAGVAEEAGVTRLTVYRHFPDIDSLFAACSRHWAELHPGPDAEAWRAIPGLEARARLALTELYGWYRRNGHELYPIYRDVASVPAVTRDAARSRYARMADVLVEGQELDRVAARRLRAAAGHVVSFWTWHSLALEQGLDDAAAVDLAVGFLSRAAQRAAAGRRPGPRRAPISARPTTFP